MTDITRIFNYETRSFKNLDKRYSGQLNDASSTTLHFIYEPIDFLKGSIDGDRFIPYIMFAVYRKDGTPYTYGPTPVYDPETESESPTFDGYTFTIPWEVTHNATSQKVEYQLFFVRNGVTFDPRTGVANLSSTDYLLSSIDGIAFKKSITCSKKQKACPSMTPNSEPTIVGYINLWKEYGMVMPIESDVDPETGRLTLEFHTYNGEKDQELELDFAPLVDGRIPTKFLPLASDWSEPTDDTVPTSRLVRETLDDEFTKKTMAVALWDSAAEYKRNSVVIWDENLYIGIKEDAQGVNVGHDPSEEDSEWWSTVTEYDMILTSWTTDVPEEGLLKKVPCERIVLEALAEKIGEDKVISVWSAPGDLEQYVPSAKLVKASLDLKLDKSSIIDNWSQAAQDNVASAQLVKLALSDKTDVTMAIPVWDPIKTYRLNSTVLYAESIYISLADANVGHEPSEYIEWWVQVSGSGGGGGGGPTLKRKSIQFGNDEDTEYILTHNLGSYDFLWSLRTNDEERRYVIADIFATSNTTCKVRLAEPPGANALTLNLMELGVSPGGADVSIISISTPSTVWTYDNTSNNAVFVQTFEYSEAQGYYDEIRGDVQQESSTGFTPVTDTFGVAKAGEMLVAKTELVKEFTNTATWIFNHNLSEYVAVQCYKDGTGMAMGNISQDGNTVVVDWPQPESGYLVLVEPSMVVDLNNEGMKIIPHSLGRIVGVQLFTDEYGQVMADVHQNGTSMAMVELNAPLTGKIVII